MAGWLHPRRVVLSAAIGIAIPPIVYLVNGDVGGLALVIGATIGVICWYFGPQMLLY